MRPTKCRVKLEELLDLDEGRAAPAEAERLRAHLASGCEACSARVSEFGQLGRLRSVMRQGELDSAPDHVLSRARDLFRERFVKPARRPLFAQLVFDSRSRLALSGARGAESGQIQALYSTGEHDVDLWQEQDPEGRWYVICQVLPKSGGTPVEVEEAALSVPGARYTASRQGSEIHLESIPSGIYTLQIGLPDAEITADAVQVGS
jgi:hypothetical protein